jgi:hypothetical protein
VKRKKSHRPKNYKDDQTFFKHTHLPISFVSHFLSFHLYWTEQWIREKLSFSMQFSCQKFSAVSEYQKIDFRSEKKPGLRDAGDSKPSIL